MKQHADERPDPSFARKAAIASGRATDHAGKVAVERIKDFDLDRTIFTTLEGAAARFVMATRVGREPVWHKDASAAVEAAYQTARAEHPLPEVDPALLRFMVQECDFDVEHADGSFLDHLYFCFEYNVHHYPHRSPLVSLLHSILGTGTNTFAMGAEKIPELKALMTPFEWRHVEAFPTLLRLLYDLPLRRELRARVNDADVLQSISFHRVIDNAPLTMTGEDLWIQLNYQLIHLIDFLPAANWAMHANETAFILFRDLFDLLTKCGKLETKLGYSPATGAKTLVGEKSDLQSFLTTKIPIGMSEKMAAKSVRKFSERIGHDMAFNITWA